MVCTFILELPQFLNFGVGFGIGFVLVFFCRLNGTLMLQLPCFCAKKFILPRVRRKLDDIKKYVPKFIPGFVPVYKSDFRSNSGTNSGMNSGTYFFSCRLNDVLLRRNITATITQAQFRRHKKSSFQSSFQSSFHSKSQCSGQILEQTLEQTLE